MLRIQVAKHVRMDKYLQKINTKALMTHIQKENDIIQGQKAKNKPHVYKLYVLLKAS